MFGGKSIMLEGNKNKAYRVYFPLLSIDNASIIPRTAVSWPTAKISKDGSDFVNVTNTPVAMTAGWYYLDLTQAEMNADVVRLVLGGTWAFTTFVYLEIFTNVMSLSSVISDISNLSNNNPTLAEVLSLLWMILRKAGNRKSYSLRQILSKTNI